MKLHEFITEGEHYQPATKDMKELKIRLADLEKELADMKATNSDEIEPETIPDIIDEIKTVKQLMKSAK